MQALSSYLVLFNFDFWKRNRTRDDVIIAYLKRRFGLKEIDSLTHDGVPILKWIKRLNDGVHSSFSRDDYRKYFSTVDDELKSLTGSQESFCALCGCRDRSLLEVDHILPLSLGGTSRVTNLQLLCKDCNSAKNNDLLNCSSVELKLVRDVSISAKARYRALVNSSIAKGRFKFGQCEVCGRNAGQVPLNVQLVDPILAATVCNLMVCCEECQKERHD